MSGSSAAKHQRWFLRLIEPPATIRKPEVWRRARLFFVLLLALSFIVLLSNVGIWLTTRRLSIIDMLLLVSLGIAYGLGRVRSYTWGAACMIAALMLAIYIMALDLYGNGYYYDAARILSLTVAAMMLSYLLFTPRATTLVLSLNLAGLALIAVIYPQAMIVDFIFTFWLILILSVFIATASLTGHFDLLQLRRQSHALIASEERYRKLVEISPDAVTLVDLKGNILFANRQAALIYGLESPQAMIGTNGLSMISLEDRQRATDDFATILQHGPHWTEYTLIRKDGTPFAAETGLAVILDEMGRPSGFICVARDITERRRAEEAFQKNEVKFRRLIEHLPDGIVLADEQGRVIEWNREQEKITGSKREDVLGKTSHDIPDQTKGEDVQQQSLTVHHHLVTVTDDELRTTPSSSRTMENTIRRTDGTACTVLTTAFAIPGEKGVMRAFVSRDITESRRVESALRESEERLRRVTDNMRDLVCQIDANGFFLYVSPSYQAILGYSRESLTGRHFFELVHPDDMPDMVVIAQESIQTRNSRQVEFRCRHADGHYVWLEMMGNPIYNDQNELIGAVFGSRDITKRKEAEAAERELRTLAEALRDTIAALTSTLDIEVVMHRVLENVERVVPHRAASITLFEEDGPRIAYWRNFPPESETFFQSYRFPKEQYYPNIDPLNQPYMVEDTANAPHWITLPFTGWIRSHVAVPIRVRGQLVGVLNVDSDEPHFFSAVHVERLQAFADQAAIAIQNAQLYADIQHYAAQLELRVRERTAELQAAYERLKELDRLKSKFIADISHELRTPLTNINMCLYLLERDKSEKNIEHLGMLKKQFTRLIDLTESIIDFSGLESADNARTATFMSVNMNKIAVQAMADHQMSADTAGLNMVFEPEVNLPPVWGQADSLMRVASNLVANAVAYTPAGRVQIRTFSNAAQTWICLEVRDTGMGIAAEDLPHLFERFYRGKNAGSSNIPGTGLGLTIAKQVVDRHGGYVEIESVPDQGSTFRVWLPATTAET
jgi:PAS domain S-box-containing protein